MLKGLWIFLLLLAAAALIFCLAAAVMYFRIMVKSPLHKSREYDGSTDLSAAVVSGFAWAERNAEKKTDLTLKSGRLALHGEYYDFGCRSTVVLVHGHRDSLCFCYWFADLFEGFNLLFVDNRAHGKSGGRIITMGEKEAEDLIGWIGLLNEKFRPERVLLWGGSMGAATVITAAGQPSLPENVCGVIADSGFSSFYELIRMRLEKMKLPSRLFAQLCRLYCRLFGGTDIKTQTPAVAAARIRIPVLFLHGKRDKTVPHVMSDKNFAAVKNDGKRIVKFSRAGHVRSRIYYKEEYDAAVSSFVRDCMVPPSTNS